MELVDLLVKDETNKNNPSLNLGKLNLLLNLYYPWLLSNVKGLTKYVNVNILPYHNYMTEKTTRNKGDKFYRSNRLMKIEEITSSVRNYDVGRWFRSKSNFTFPFVEELQNKIPTETLGINATYNSPVIGLIGETGAVESYRGEASVAASLKSAKSYPEIGEGNAAFVNSAAPAISKPGLAYVEVDKVKRKNKSKNERLYKMAAAIQRNKYTSNLIKAHKYSTFACLNLKPNDLILRK